MTERTYPRFTLDIDDHAGSERMRRIVGQARYIIASRDAKPVIEHRSSGQAHYMTYKSYQKARVGLQRARVHSQLTELHIYDLDAQGAGQNPWRA